ncbi:MAG: (2Fe-2S)-binding protein [Acidobacteriota bacterium]|nr:MAG: (2Fe-2S)-binding protein [Acidobacteriota bacterium]
MGIYPQDIEDIIASCIHSGEPDRFDAVGVDANIRCGSWLRFALRIEDGNISAIGYTSNGCGFMIAAAETLSRRIDGCALSELHGLDAVPVRTEDGKGTASDRPACSDAALSALRKALAEYREKAIAASGDKALACTCFSITIDTIEAAAAKGADTLEKVQAECRAGGGCGSCRMLIQEIIDRENTMFIFE